LTGDEMFLEHILDDEGDLNPTSESGWNIYCKTDRASKATVADSKLRTDLVLEMDRVHPYTLLDKIPLDRTVLCLLHGATLIVEKLLDIELGNIYSEAKKYEAKNVSGSLLGGYVANLESNINKRGVRQGNFQIITDEMGKPQPVSLNKDHAYTIISPPLAGKVQLL